MLNHAVEETKERLRVFAANVVTSTSSSRVNSCVYPDEARVEIDIEAQSGPRAIGSANCVFSKQALDEDFVRKPGQDPGGRTVSCARTGGDRPPPRRRGYFSRVEVRPRRDEGGWTSQCRSISCWSRRTGVWRAGAGYATDTGVRVASDTTTVISIRKGTASAAICVFRRSSRACRRLPYSRARTRIGRTSVLVPACCTK